MKIVYSGGEAEIVEKKSRFIATVRPVLTEEDASAFIGEMKRKYWDARHNCSAFVLGERNETGRCSDDGEPAQTAGRPMLDVLLREDIHNAAVVVTRYFGGVLLGTGGLVRAYQRAVQEGLAASVVTELCLGRRLTADIGYDWFGKLNYLIAQEGFVVLDTIYTEGVRLRLLIPMERQDAAEKAILDATNGCASLSWGEKARYVMLAGGKAEIVAS